MAGVAVGDAVVGVGVGESWQVHVGDAVDDAVDDHVVVGVAVAVAVLAVFGV